MLSRAEHSQAYCEQCVLRGHLRPPGDEEEEYTCQCEGESSHDAARTRDRLLRAVCHIHVRQTFVLSMRSPSIRLSVRPSVHRDQSAEKVPGASRMKDKSAEKVSGASRMKAAPRRTKTLKNKRKPDQGRWRGPRMEGKRNKKVPETGPESTTEASTEQAEEGHEETGGGAWKVQNYGGALKSGTENAGILKSSAETAGALGEAVKICDRALQTCSRAAEAQLMEAVRPRTPHGREQEVEAAHARAPLEQELEPGVEATRHRAPPEKDQAAVRPRTAQEQD
ncbi:hypothetical protein CRENBAI_006927 [Crenichthys baileyi]|uniref:Uncharacterized protein n=1 Tax=Crenichthys baileyi TaxID=28760 RepID=A0AAV9S5Q8_9TELE